MARSGGGSGKKEERKFCSLCSKMRKLKTLLVPGLGSLIGSPYVVGCACARSSEGVSPLFKYRYDLLLVTVHYPVGFCEAVSNTGM